MGQNNGHRVMYKYPDDEKQQQYGGRIEVNSEETHFVQTLS